MRREATRLDLLVDVETPEQITLSYTVAGIGSRAMAALYDYLVCFVLLVTLIFLVIPFASVQSPAREVVARSVTAPWAVAVLILAQFVVVWGYYVLFETLWDGQTPGKRRVGIRVVQDGGYSISFAASAVRNIARVIDMQPGLAYIVGMASAVLSKSGKRLGDVMAGTMVVHERAVPLAALAAAPAGGDAAAAPTSTVLTDDEFELLGRYLGRRAELNADRRAALDAQLLERYRGSLPADTASPWDALGVLFEAERVARTRGVAARGDVGAAREQHALVARGMPRWRAFGAALAAAQRHGLRALSEEGVSTFVSQYREVASDLARLRTAARGRDVDAVYYVTRLVASGHNLLYRQKPVSARAVRRYLLVAVPGEIRRSAPFILAAACALFLPAAVAYTAVVGDPRVAEELLPPQMIDRAEGAPARAAARAGYITIRDFERPVMASGIVANNIQVTYAVFAFGITAGIGTILLLVLNGISIGAAVGIYASKGVALLILDFVSAHAVLELSAIAIAGGGGLLIAHALVLPGALPRRDALVVGGRRAIRLIAGSSLLLVVAGVIEGLISPRTDWPTEWKWAVAALTALLLAIYVSLGRGEAPDAEEESAYTPRYSAERDLISR